jgi:hypothetical protein
VVLVLLQFFPGTSNWRKCFEKAKAGHPPIDVPLFRVIT